MKGVAGNCNGAIAQMLKNPLKGKRDREFGSMSSQELVTLKEKSGELFKVKEKLRGNYLRLKWRGIG